MELRSTYIPPYRNFSHSHYIAVLKLSHRLWTWSLLSLSPDAIIQLQDNLTWMIESFNQHDIIVSFWRSRFLPWGRSTMDSFRSIKKKLNRWVYSAFLVELFIVKQMQGIFPVFSVRSWEEYIAEKQDTYWLLTLSTETVSTLEAGDFQLISIVDEAIRALKGEKTQNQFSTQISEEADVFILPWWNQPGRMRLYTDTLFPGNISQNSTFDL